jgi:hypothetical protein
VPAPAIFRKSRLPERKVFDMPFSFCPFSGRRRLYLRGFAHENVVTELWFARLNATSLRAASSAQFADLRRKIGRYIKAYSASAKRTQ